MVARGSSPTVREGVDTLSRTPFLTVGLLPRFADSPIRFTSRIKFCAEDLIR